MIWLGVDLGERRIGFAVADGECPIATMLPTVTLSDKNAAAMAISEQVKKHTVEVVVLGLPLDLNGRRGVKAREAQQLAEKLIAAGIRVELWDERLTTEEARRTLIDAGLTRKQRGKHLDGLAAQRILSSYLNAMGSPN